MWLKLTYIEFTRFIQGSILPNANYDFNLQILFINSELLFFYLILIRSAFLHHCFC